jgi:CRP-like cAMP-binding protein
MSQRELTRAHQKLFMGSVLRVENGNRLLAKVSLSIPAEGRDILELSLSRTRFAAGETVFDENRVLFVEKGIVSPMALTRDGASLGVGIIGSEGAIGLAGIGKGDYGFHVRALTAVEAFQVSAQALSLACSRSSELENLLKDYLQALFSDSISTLLCHYHHDLRARLPRWLLVAADRLGSNRLPLTQEILAETLGVTQGAISMVLDGLRSKGLIESTRKEIIVLNRKRLRSTACRCYLTVDREKKYVINHRIL